MRPLKLTMQAFGPFATNETVDFTDFGENAFFLIHGPTGAGKTSILDAICYALYGSLSGSTRDERTIRSQHAAKELLCEVEFQFQIGPRYFHIRRSPEQIIEKKGKEQKTVHRVEFCEVDDAGVVIGGRLSKVGEVRDKIEEILGFTAEQFSQVVVLPQGEFRKLLLASSTDKEKILEKLFGTERFKRIESMLKDRRDSIYKALEGIRNTVNGILEGQGADTYENLINKNDALKLREQDLSECLTLANQQQQEAIEALNTGNQIADKFLKLSKAKSEVGRLESQRDSMDNLKNLVQRGKRAISLADLDAALENDRTIQKSLTAQISNFGKELVQKNGELSIVAGERDKLRLLSDAIPAKASEKTVLESRLKAAEDLSRIESSITDATQKRNQSVTFQESLQNELTRVEDEYASNAGLIEELTLSIGRRGEFEQKLKEADVQAVSLQNLTDAVSICDKLNAEREALSAKCLSEEKHYNTIIADHDDLTRRLIYGQAAHLAKALSAGSPCPVCGSLEHPEPAKGSDEVPTEEHIASARTKMEKAGKQLEKSKDFLSGHDIQIGEARSTISALRKQLGALCDVSLETLLAARQDLKDKFDKIVADENKLLKLRKNQEGLHAHVAGIKLKLLGANQALQAATSQLDILLGQQQAKLKELGDENSDIILIQKEIKAIDQFITTTSAKLKTEEERFAKLQQEASTLQGKKNEAERSAGELASRLSKAEMQFVTRISQAGFANEDDYRSARIPVEQLEASEKEVISYSELVTVATSELLKAESACLGLIAPDIEDLTAQKAAAEGEVSRIAVEKGSITTQIAATHQAISSIDAYRKETEQQEMQLKVVGNLANLAAGNNSKRITLQRFVLASLFEEVALAASERLSRMSRGRYHLRRSESVEDARRGAGLDLEVTDDFTGLHRPASTLSGGETFLASLSLALGLSDVVLAQSGGRYLDTLFIDEGFGTLDSETLDIAMDTLMKINEQGRVIGIISHVSELKEQIPQQLQVLPSRNGSRVNIVN